MFLSPFWPRKHLLETLTRWKHAGNVSVSWSALNQDRRQELMAVEDGLHLHESKSRFVEQRTSELVISLMAGEHFVDGLLGADSDSGVQKHGPLWSTPDHLKPRTFSFCRRLQQLCQTLRANGLRFDPRVQPGAALWTGSRQEMIQDQSQCRPEE